MAGALERFEHKFAGYKRIMRSAGMQTDLDARAQKVKAAAEAQIDDPDVYILADVTVGKTRAGATIIGVPMRLESRKRILGRAIDAAG